MPRGDGTGPAGAGPMTGRQAGRCAGYEAPGVVTPGPGRGLAMVFGRRGGGRGRRHRFRAGGLAACGSPLTREQERKAS